MEERREGMGGSSPVEQNEVIGSDYIKVYVGKKQGLSAPTLEIVGAGQNRELCSAERVVAFFNPDNRSAKVVLYQGNKFILKVRPNVTRVEVISY